jgi:hypothetical protein
VILLLLHSAATLFMTGLVWFVQVVHYPLMHRVGASGFARYEAEHARRTSPVVAPVMLFELASGVWLALEPPARIGATPLLLNAAILAVLWISTFWLQLPAHRDLAEGYDRSTVIRLVASNWIRTAAWTLRALLLVGLLILAADERDSRAGALSPSTLGAAPGRAADTPTSAPTTAGEAGTDAPAAPIDTASAPE